MNEYIFYTTEGFAQDPNGKDVENCQLIGMAFGSDCKDALHNLIANNSWIENHHFDPGKFICKELRLATTHRQSYLFSKICLQRGN